MAGPGPPGLLQDVQLSWLRTVLRTLSVPNTVSEPPPGPPEPAPGPPESPPGPSEPHIQGAPQGGTTYWGGSDGPGGDSGGPGGGSGGPSWSSETVFRTDVRNRQCSEQCSEPTQL